MAYHDDLLRQAHQLAHSERTRPKQASLRRSVSTAYYALFHLLIAESVANWRKANHRPELARAFDHSTMKAASNRIQDRKQFPFEGVDSGVVNALKFVAKTFVVLQENRQLADYDNSTFWSKTEALSLIRSAERAFAGWQSIRDEPIAQQYLLSLLVKRRA